MSLIFSLLMERNWENVHSLLAVNPDCVFEKDASGVEPLFYCLENYEVTALILNKNTKAVQSTNCAGNTPLHVALSMGAAVSFNVIKLLIKNFPMACMEVNALGNLPLHVLFQYHKSPGGVDINYYEAERKRFLDTMGLLLAHNSKAHSAKNRDGKLPLHFAAAKNVYVEAVKMLTEKRGGNPSGVWCKDTRNGSLPLHCAIAATAQLYKEIGPPDQQLMCAQAGVEGSSAQEPPTKANYLRVIELLLGLYPDSVYELDGRSNSAFILAIKYNAPVRVFMMLGGVQENMGAEMIQVPPPGAPGPPAQLAVSDTVGLPSDGAMASSHLEVANRSTTGSASSSGPPLKSIYPVHFAVRFANISAALVNYLIELFPDSVNYTEDNIHYQNLRNEMGTFPLHMALENCCRHEVIVALLRASPIIASIRNPDIKLCLHFATWKQFPLDVVRSLHEAFPDGIRRKEEKYGNLPIHYAIQYHCHPGVIKYLFEQYPEGARAGTKAGKLPLHLACRYMSPLEVISEAMERFPEAAGMCDRSGRIPYDYLLEYEAPAAVLKVLLGVRYDEVEWDEQVVQHPSSLPTEQLDAKSDAISGHMDEVEAAPALKEVGGGDEEGGEEEEEAGDLPDLNASKKKTFSSLFHRNRKNSGATVCTYEKLIKQLTNRNQQMVAPTPGKFNKLYSGVQGAITWLQCEVVALYRYIHQLRDELEQCDREMDGLRDAAAEDANTIRKLNKTIATLQRNLDFAESQGQVVSAPEEGAEDGLDGEFACPSFGVDKEPAVKGVFGTKKKQKDNFVQVIQTVIR